MKRRRTLCFGLLLGLSFMLLPPLSQPVFACDTFEETGFGIFEQSRWYRYDARTNRLTFCMKIKRLAAGVDPIYLEATLKTGDIFTTIRVLDRQPVPIDIGECKTVCWRFDKPEELDLNNFFEYTDFESEGGILQDFIWRVDRIEGTTAHPSAIATESVETMTWPLFNVATKTMESPRLVMTSVDLSDALPGWQVMAIEPAPGSPFMLYPGETPVGTITIGKPACSTEGVSVIRPRLIDVDTGEMIQQAHLRFKIDATPPEVIEARARVENHACHFLVTAADAQSGVADTVQVHYFVNGEPCEPSYLEQFGGMGGASVSIVDSPCTTCQKPTTFTRSVGPFESGVVIDYYFTIQDEVGNTVKTVPATIQVR